MRRAVGPEREARVGLSGNRCGQGGLAGKEGP